MPAQAGLSRTAVVLVRLGGFLAALLYTSVWGYLFPDRRLIRRALDGAPEVWGWVEECGRLLPQTIPHPIAKCAKGWGTRLCGGP
jgi:hypothetical protein